MIVAVAVTCEATVPIIVNAIITDSISFAVLPKRRSKSSGIEVRPYLKPMSDILPEIPEKMNMPSR